MPMGWAWAKLRCTWALNPYNWTSTWGLAYLYKSTSQVQTWPFIEMFSLQQGHSQMVLLLIWILEFVALVCLWFVTCGQYFRFLWHVKKKIYISDSCGGRMLLLQSQGITNALMFLMKQRLTKLLGSTIMLPLISKSSSICRRAWHIILCPSFLSPVVSAGSFFCSYLWVFYFLKVEFVLMSCVSRCSWRVCYYKGTHSHYKSLRLPLVQRSWPLYV